MSEFYDQMASLYHLIFPNWEESIERQATQLSSIIYERWPGAETILDVSCGIGTQSIGLAKRDAAVLARTAHWRRYDLERFPDDPQFWARAAEVLRQLPESARNRSPPQPPRMR